MLLWSLLASTVAFAQSYHFTTVSGLAGSQGSADGADGTARYGNPYGLAVDGSGNLYIADTGSNTIRMLSRAGTNWAVTTIAGLAGSAGSADGSNSVARFDSPYGVAVDNGNNVYVADQFNGTIRKLVHVGTNWVVSTIAGLAGFIGVADGTNNASRFYFPAGLAVDASGNLYVADQYNHTIRKVTPVGTNWVVTTLAGQAGSLGTVDGTNKVARFAYPLGVAVDASGHVYVADHNGATIRSMTALGTNWVVTTIAGVPGVPNWADGTNQNASFDAPDAIAVDVSSNLYVADDLDGTIRKITPQGTNWVVTTIGGQPYTIGSADGTGSGALFNSPNGIAVDSMGNVFVADTLNQTIRLGTVAVATNIAYLRSLQETVNFTPTNTTTLFQVQGIVTTWTNMTTVGNTEFYMQDATAGIAVFWSGAAGSNNTPPAGALVQVTATLSSFNGLLELAPASTNGMTGVKILSTGNPLPTPLPLPFDPNIQNNPTNMEMLEGSYFVAANVYLDLSLTNSFVALANELITNSTGQTFDLFINSHTDIPGKAKPAHATIYGVLGQFVTNAPYTSGYEFTPSRYADIVPCPTITISPSTLPNWTVGLAYSQTLSAAGGAAPYTFSVASGAVPTGLTLAAGGSLSGTPTAAGAYSFTALATDTNGCAAVSSYTVTVLPAGITYWDPQGFWGSASGFTSDMSGAWEDPSWSTNNLGQTPTMGWAEGRAVCFGIGTGLGTPPFTITMNSNHTIAGIFDGSLFPDACDVTINGNGIWTIPTPLQGFNAHNAGDGSLGIIRINVVLAGPGTLTAESNGQLFLNGINTYTGGTQLGFGAGAVNFTGTLNFNNSSSFGTGPISVYSSGGALAVEGTAPITITNTVKFISTNLAPRLNLVGNPAGLTFSGNWNLSSNSPVIGLGGATNLVTISGVISGSGGLTKFNSGILVLSGANSYTGSTIVSNGVLLLSGSLGTGGATVAGGTLSGTGTINDSVTVQAGGTLAPGGSSIGALTMVNLSLQGGSTNVVRLNRGLGTNDSIIGLANVSYGGTLSLSNIDGNLAAGDAFKLFSAPSYTGAFATLSPVMPGPGLGWDTSTLSVDGTLRVVALTAPFISSQPQSQSAAADSSAGFTVTAAGTAPLSYQWQFNGTNLTDNGHVAGSQSASLIISNLQSADAGNYQVVITNAYGSTNSVVALLTVTYSNIIGHYTPDPYTLHLWHLDDAAAPAADAVASAPLPLNTLGGGATLNNASFAGFGTSLSTYDGGPNGTNATDLDAALSALPTPNGYTNFNYADPVTGAFTYEAAVRVDFDPTLNYGPVATGGNGRNFPMQIMSAEGSVNAGRLFQFRLDPIGFSAFVGDPGTNSVRLEFINVNHGAAQNILFPVPATGPDAILPGQWYHVAVSYNGIPGTSSNILFYWTLLTSGRTNASLLGAGTMSNSLPAGTAPNFVIGNNGRPPGGITNVPLADNFVGLIDEVRMSSVARSPQEMQLTPSAPVIIIPPLAQTVAAGSQVSFAVRAAGNQPLSYQWQHVSTNVVDNARITGSQSPLLTISNVRPGDAGVYRVVVTNAYGLASSTFVSLGVVTSLRAYLKFDESSGATAADSTSNGWTGTLVNGPVFVTGFSNNAVGFNGINQYVALPAGVVNGPSDFTIATWVRLNSVTTWARIFDFGNNTTVNMFLTPLSSSGFMRFAITTAGNTAEQQINTSRTLAIGQWHHVAVTLAATTGTLYVDGLVVGSSTLTLNPSSLGSTTNNWIGHSQYPADPFLDGQVDDFRIYNGALSAGAVHALATVVAPAFTSQPQNLVVAAGSNVTFSAIASGTAPLNYQWQLNGINLTDGLRISGSQSNILTIAGAQFSDEGAYRLVATNVAGPATSALASLSVLSSSGAFVPIALTSGSFNQDVVVEKTALAPLSAGGLTTSSMDGGTANTATTWYERGFNTDAPTTGLPPAGSTVTNLNLTDHVYLLAPSYVSSNALLIDSANSGSFNLTSPASYAALSFLASAANSGGNPMRIAYTAFHADGTQDTGIIPCFDWFAVSAGALSNNVTVALVANGRANAQTFAPANVNSGAPVLYSVDVILSNTNSAVTNIALSFSSGGGSSHAGIFAVSGAASVGGPFNSIAVTGYNQDLVMEATGLTLTNATTASMDAGISNTGNTWYEQGYNPANLASGLPSAGSTFTNASVADRSYTMPPSYTNANAVLINSSSPAALITLAAPSRYAALSLLHATANAGTSAATVQCIIVHLDGSTETNIFTSTDWFNSVPRALSTGGRINLNNRVPNNVGTTNPRLYFADFNVANTNVAVSNIVVTWIGGAATNETAIFALSGVPIPMTTPVLTWTNPAPVIYGAALGPSQLNAIASVPGNFVYTPAAGTLLDTGTNTLSAIFTPNDSVDYSSVTGSVSLVVLPAPLSVAANNAVRPYGQTNPVFTGTLLGVTNSDNITATYGSSATASSLPGLFPIVPSLVDPSNRLVNYTVTSQNGTLTVSPPASSLTNPPVFIYKLGTDPLAAGRFLQPKGVAVDSAGNLYVADTLNSRVQKFSSNGVFLTQWGSRGTNAGQFDFNGPTGIAVDTNGNVFVVDTGNGRVQKFSASGAFILQWGSIGTNAGQFNEARLAAVDSSGNLYVADVLNSRIQKFSPTGAFLLQFGSRGSANGQFRSPRGVAVDGSGNVYVADTVNNRVQKFSSSGTYILQWGGPGTNAGQFAVPYGIATDGGTNVYVSDSVIGRIEKFDSTGNYLAQWGTVGAGNGQFAIPYGVAVDSSGNVYVADLDNNRVQKFTSAGNFLAALGNTDVPGDFLLPDGVARDGAGNLYVADSGNYRIEKFSPSGAYLTQWGSVGTGPGQFDFIQGLAVDAGGNVFVSETPNLFPNSGNDRIQKFDSSGNFLLQWGSSGSSTGQFFFPIGVAVDGSGNVYVADNGNARVQKFDNNGNFLAQGGNLSTNSPTGVAVDGANNIYTADLVNDAVQKFDSNGNFLLAWGSFGRAAGQFDQPNAIGVDGIGGVYVADSNNNRIQKFNSGGNVLTLWGGLGTNNGQFNYPAAVIADASGNFVYVADTYNSRIEVFGYIFPPFITTQPASQVTAVGSNVTFTVVASSQSAVSYQWLFNGTNITGATGASLTLTNLHTANAGSYQVTVSNLYGATPSATATLLVQTPLVITCASNLTVECGTAWTFTPPAVSDTCASTNFIVTVLSTVTNTSGHCGNTFDATRTWRVTDACSNTQLCSQTITIVDTSAPVFSGVSNLTFQCGSAWNFLPPTATDACSGTNVTLAVFTTVTNPICGNSFVATRTWKATDGCSNSAFFSQAATIMDTNPPVLVCASNFTVECPMPWAFTPPVVVDSCSGTNVTVVIVSTVTNPPNAQTYSATRTWRASDACSNSATCSQTITIIDTTPPVITCSTNIVIECTGTAGAPVFFTTTATDTCNPNPVVVCTPPSGTVFYFGTNYVRCVATDAAGNSNICIFTINVRDTTPPQITCPSNLAVAENPRDSGHATVIFPTPVVSDICDASPLVYFTPPSGPVVPVGSNAVLQVGSNTVICTAVDRSGNSNSCTFNVRVIPYRLRVTVSSTADSGPGTLRQALLDANDSPDANLILFNLPGTAPFTIHLLSALPPQTSPVSIDGWTQPGFSNVPPVIELDGSTASNAIDGLVLLAGSSTIRGLALHGFATAVRLQGPGLNVIQDNFIGTDLTGTNAAGNAGDGIYISSSHNLIGGDALGLGNVISGNGGNGVTLDTASANHNTLQGNLIGLAADGVSPLGNAASGIFLTNQANANLIGGSVNGYPNEIAFNGHNGITLAASAGQGNALLGNSIFSNSSHGGLGIDLGDDGVTTNDASGHVGPNAYQNFPVLTDAIFVPATTLGAVDQTTISGVLTSTPSTTFRLEFFLNNAANPSGYGEGQTFIGAAYISSDGSGAASFSNSYPVTASYTNFITATATDPANDTSEFSGARQVRSVPVISAPPVAQTNAPVGGTNTFMVDATNSSGGFFFQWRLNGFNIPGATNSTYFVNGVQVTNGGAYSVLVQNSLGTVITPPADLTLGAGVPTVQGADNFSNAVSLFGTSNLVAGQNRAATFETNLGEPFHDGEVGGKSVWYNWLAPVTGVASMSMAGSTFDTLLAIYTGTSLSNLEVIAADENHAGFYTSKTLFNVLKGTRYMIAIDGRNGASGDYVFSMNVQDTPHLLPIFVVQPFSQTVASNSTAIFSAVAFRVCGQGHTNCPNPDHFPEDELPQLFYQWLSNDVPILGATSPMLTLSNVQASAVATYNLQVATLWQTNTSDDAVLQINSTGGGVQQVQAFDKFVDAAQATPLVLGTGVASGQAVGGNNGPPGASPAGVNSIVSGYTGTQIFATAGSGADSNEVVCAVPEGSVIGGSSQIIPFTVGQPGTLFLDTIGSSFNTLLEVFQANATNSSIRSVLPGGCGAVTNGIPGARVLKVNVTNNITYYILVDGVNGTFGTVSLHYSLDPPVALKAMGMVQQSMNHVQVIGRSNLNFTLQVSTNLASWTSLFTTNAPAGVFDFIDSSPANTPRRYYRALVLP